MFKIEKSVRNFQVGKWSQGRMGSPFATSRKISGGWTMEEKPTVQEPKMLNKEICALLEEASFITGSRLGVKRRRLGNY